MTDEPQTDEPTEDQIDDYHRRRRALQPDSMLAIFVMMANERDDGLGQPVTLTVGGSLISGLIVGRVKWIEELLDHYGEPVQGLRAFRDHWAESAEEMASDKPMAPFDTMIHLKDARWFLDSTGTALPREGSFWRCRLSEVQGWTLGTLENSA
jgi:hypothetical protein